VAAVRGPHRLQGLPHLEHRRGWGPGFHAPGGVWVPFGGLDPLVGGDTNEGNRPTGSAGPQSRQGLPPYGLACKSFHCLHEADSMQIAQASVSCCARSPGPSGGAPPASSLQIVSSSFQLRPQEVLIAQPERLTGSLLLQEKNYNETGMAIRQTTRLNRRQPHPGTPTPQCQHARLFGRPSIQDSSAILARRLLSLSLIIPQYAPPPLSLVAPAVAATGTHSLNHSGPMPHSSPSTFVSCYRGPPSH
jgi:hypothetical protein